jgi:GxxExxY protein
MEDVPGVELKVVSALAEVRRMQCTNHLKASGPRLGLLLNFGNPRLEIGRVAERHVMLSACWACICFN